MRRRRAVATLAAAVLLAGACGADDPAESAQAPPATDPDPRSAESSPFTVGDVPDGFVARAAGRGLQEPMWGEDCCGTDEPYVVLSPDGTPDHPDLVLVSITGYEGYQGGLDQASAGYGDPAEVVEVDGDDARFAPAVGGEPEEGAHWADLVVDQGGEGLAIRVTSPEATLDELAAIVPHVVVPDDRTRPPAVPDPPAGLEVVGAVDAFAVVAAQPIVDQQSDAGPGPPRAHGVGWRQGGDHRGDQLAVMTLPGRAADLAALVAGARWGGGWPGEVDAVLGDAHATFQEVDPHGDGGSRRSAWVAHPDGDLVVAASYGPDAVPADDLLALARSVEPTDEATWAAFVEDVRGGPGFHADPGRTELMRGPVGDGREWLLQTQAPGEGNMGFSSDGRLWSVDPCLKISDGERTCPQTEGDGIDTWSASGPGPRDDAGVPYLTVATTRPEAAALRVTTDGAVTTVPLVDVPGTEERTAAVVGEGYQLGLCHHEAPPTGPRIVELVDAAGTPLTC